MRVIAGRAEGLMLASVFLAIAALLVIAGAAEAQAQKRVALVIGNDAYQSLSRLNNPALDADRLAVLLEANGFEVLKCDGQRPGCFDLTREALQDALDTLQDKAKGADLALVFYSGHGMRGADGDVLAPINMEVVS